MKASLLVMTAALAISNLALADTTVDPQLIHLNISDITQEFGCGVPPPHGGGCPTSTTIVISMPGVKGCQKPEDFSVQVVQTEKNQELTINRKPGPCGGTTFPPQSDVVSLYSGDLLQGKPIQIMNPLAPTLWARP